MGLNERENEDTKDVVLGILTRVIPMAVGKLREMVDTVQGSALHKTRCQDPSSFTLQRRRLEMKSVKT